MVIPQDFIDAYNLEQKFYKYHLYCKILRGMYGLPDAGKLSNTQLKKLLATHGYHECQSSPVLFKHESRPTYFTLFVDDFGVKYVGEHNLQHIIYTLQKYYEIQIDYEGKKYVGINLE